MRVFLTAVIVLFGGQALAIGSLDEEEMDTISAQYVGGTPIEIDQNIHQSTDTLDNSLMTPTLTEAMPTVMAPSAQQDRLESIAPGLPFLIKSQVPGTEGLQNLTIPSRWVSP